MRVLPTLEEVSAFFWTSGRDGKLRFLQCPECAYLIHPPTPRCPHCLAADPVPAEVSGRGVVYSFTVNHQPWDGTADPYVIASVAIDEQPELRLTTNLVEVDPESVCIGMRVEALFQDHDPVFLPVFRPVVE
ncbi:OB-fold domain-containing protein [Mycobacterium sp. OTB74]|jgi:uncharacterized OB-fold protein|uniref:Zn-ribbon domain-containing OB-fold protein n=1 Tax=Mycobacterium sp. OTB74 TaxID=1853452 RepID=UPI0024746828|nr:OB-fold domain-containing protein [Mycobacterium sp. OTB74]MDH6242740.1 putative OB-fold protein [Mycobacterium sp. OTB74]